MISNFKQISEMARRFYQTFSRNKFEEPLLLTFTIHFTFPNALFINYTASIFLKTSEFHIKNLILTIQINIFQN